MQSREEKLSRERLAKNNAKDVEKMVREGNF